MSALRTMFTQDALCSIWAQSSGIHMVVPWKGSLDWAPLYLIQTVMFLPTSNFPIFLFSHLPILFIWISSVIKFASNKHFGQWTNSVKFWSHHPYRPQNFRPLHLYGNAKSLHSSPFAMFIMLISAFSPKTWTVSYWLTGHRQLCQGRKT